jgi:hypothetical protein
MKTKLLLIITIIAGILFTACHGDKCCVVEPEGDLLYAMRNNADWTVPAKATRNGADTLIVSGTSGQYTVAMRLKKGAAASTYTLLDANYYITMGDIVTNYYELDATKTNFVTINTYDTGTQVLRASFSLFLTLKNGVSAGTNPATVSFTSGNFKVKLP